MKTYLRFEYSVLLFLARWPAAQGVALVEGHIFGRLEDLLDWASFEEGRVGLELYQKLLWDWRVSFHGLHQHLALILGHIGDCCRLDSSLLSLYPFVLLLSSLHCRVLTLQVFLLHIFIREFDVDRLIHKILLVLKVLQSLYPGVGMISLRASKEPALLKVD